MNVTKTKTGDKLTKNRIYDIENIDLSYAYTEFFNRNIDVEYNTRKTYRFVLGYNFMNNPKNYRPFSKSSFFKKHKSFSLISDFNFYILPRTLSFRSDIDRQYHEQLMRNKTEALILLEPTYMKTFNWNRFYNIKYDLTRSLKFDFTANVIARVDEMPGRLHKDDSDYQIKRDPL